MDFSLFRGVLVLPVAIGTFRIYTVASNCAGSVTAGVLVCILILAHRMVNEAELINLKQYPS
jgi:hypothetical protein